VSSASINHHLRDDDYQELLLSGGQLSMSLTRSPRNDEIASRFDPGPVFLDNGKESGFHFQRSYNLIITMRAVIVCNKVLGDHITND
jgi:hypothetical protein